MINASSVFQLPGTEPGQVVSLQIRAWTSFGAGGQTDIRQVTLAPTAGPGTVIWQTATGTNPNRFTPLVLFIPDIPEPSTIALAALGLGSLLLLRRWYAAGSAQRARPYPRRCEWTGNDESD